MSILYRFESKRPLLEIVQLWRIPGTSARQLVIALIRALETGKFDRVDDGRPGMLICHPGEAPCPITSKELFADHGWNGLDRAGEDLAEYIAENFWITRAAVLAFAEKWRIPPPDFWQAEPPAESAATPAAEMPSATARRGRQPGKGSKREISQEFAAMRARGAVDYGRGGLRQAASALLPKFKDYKLDSIERIIRQEFKAAKKKALNQL